MFTANTFNFKMWHLFLAFILIYYIVSYLNDVFISTDAYFYSAFGNKFDSEQIGKIIIKKNEYTWLGYTFLPFLLFLKFITMAALIYMGSFLFDYIISYKDCLKTILIAEFSSVFGLLSKTIYLLVNKPKTIMDVEHFSSLSLTQLINASKIPDYLYYPLQLINVFEIAYWLMLIFGLAYFTKVTLYKASLYVAATYGVGLFIWVLVIVFIKLQFS